MRDADRRDPPPPGGALPAREAPLLEVEDLRVEFPMEYGAARAVDGVSLAIRRGEMLGVAGESGSGETVTALSILRLLSPPGRIVGGKIRLAGEDLLALSEREMRRVRGERIAMIFQEPMTSLNPVFTVGAQIVEAIRAHRRISAGEAREEAVRLLERVRIPAARERFGEYPHRLSGGMRQRVMIAMALACRPELLIADEPTTALDVTIQDGILRLLEELRREMGLAVLFITHNLALLAGFAERIAVLYAGKVVEEAPTLDLFERPLHPYTRALLASMPRSGLPRGERLPAIPGAVPDPRAFPSGCRFHPRCAVRVDACAVVDPPEMETGPGRRACCHLIAPVSAPAASHPPPAASLQPPATEPRDFAGAPGAAPAAPTAPRSGS